MDIDVKVKELTTYDIGDDGKSVTLRLTDVDGTRVSLSFQIPDLGNLAMTLPSLIEAALRRQYRDGSIPPRLSDRHVVGRGGERPFTTSS